MKTLLFCILVLTHTASARTITDDYGRSVTIPEKVDKIYTASPPLTMSLLSFDPSLVAALNTPFSDAQKPYAGVAASAPVAGGFFGQGQTPNFEKLAAIRPDVILMWGKATGSQMQLKKFTALGIPVLMVRNDSINDLISQYRLYGELSGNQKRADALIAYTRETLGLIGALQPKIDARKPVRYYFAEGLDGLSSECEGSFHLEPFTYSGGKNALSCQPTSHFGMEKIPMERILMADPDVIIAMEKPFAETVARDPKWKNLRAIKSGRVLSVPTVPFNIISRPPSFMRLLGIRWLIHAFYPDLIAPIDQEKKRFERLFFPHTRG